jgi:hypothetical protein
MDGDFIALTKNDDDKVNKKIVEIRIGQYLKFINK